MLRIANVKININDKVEIKEKILKELKIKEEDIISYSIYKRSIDARDKDNIIFVYVVDLKTKFEDKVLKDNKNKVIKVENKKVEDINIDISKVKTKPVIIGFGPAGLFAALTLARKGLKPIVFERGEAIDDRVKSVDKFWSEGILNSESNVQFGEGGAGTFSDGKLTARVKKKYTEDIFEEFVKYGASEEILYVSNPHVGTDVIREVVKNIRKEIESLGGIVNFNSKLTDINIKDNKIHSIIINNNEEVLVQDLVLAIGHSARDTFEMLYKKEVSLSAKEFAVGFRVEHKQELIDKAQYGKYYNHPKLPRAEYKLTHTASNDRGVYTFCMCPGGFVVAASSEEGAVVTNGMSYSKRDAINANSAVVVQTKIEDYNDSSSLGGMNFQRKLEQIAYELGGKTYKAPYQTISKYLEEESTSDVVPTYSVGVAETNLNEILPKELNNALKEGLINFNKKIKGFNSGILTGVETRTSSPVRINRNEEYKSITLENLYPVGEGSGYSGGIVTSAIDGINGANEILKKYKTYTEENYDN